MEVGGITLEVEGGGIIMGGMLIGGRDKGM